MATINCCGCCRPNNLTAGTGPKENPVEPIESSQAKATFDVIDVGGILEADVGATFDGQLSAIDPNIRVEVDPKAHQQLRPELMFIRDELRQAKLQTLAVRREALKKLLLEDFINEDRELRSMGIAYIPIYT